ncbi:hypothetical protein AK830_g7140 [Neonectria ditissima]|uniref:Beta-lactamase-related domain-containing protein n=1 Tax=Neonectria ditissima TaxID=78410 RepID=A0A0P7BGU2_9HYPO|nr:hypothetical protein AK830_g7140 [Neonectria ditissima]
MKRSLAFLLGAVGTLLPAVSVADVTVPWINPAEIGTYNMSSLNSTDPPNAAFVTRHENELLPNRTVQVRHGRKLRHLGKGKEVDFYTTANGTRHSIDSFMYHFGISGVMVVTDGAVQSVTKSFISTALAVAIKKCKISLSDRVSKYVPELARAAYGSVPLQNLVDMISGITEQNITNPPDLFNDVYTRSDPAAALDWFKTFEKVAKPGEVFNYYNPNYYVLSLCLARAIGEPINDWTTKYIWEPAGMKHDGYMRVTAAGQVDGHDGLALTLQDMARFGLFVLDAFDGDGGPAVAKSWFHDISAASTSTGVRAPGAIAVVPNSGYQTGWWTMPRGGKTYQLGDDDGFAALGTYDQTIYVVPGMNTTIVLQSSYPVHHADLFYYGQQFATAASLALKT